jgi:hypothetical protein
MGLKEQLGDLWPDEGFVVEEPDKLVEAVEKVDGELSDEEFQAIKGGLDKALASQQRQKVILAVLTAAGKFGLKAADILT